MAYEQLQTEFLKITNYSEERLSECTIGQVAYCIRDALRKSSIPMSLLEGPNENNIWRQRYEVLIQPEILEYWHKQETTFLTTKREYDNTQSPDEKDDPWRYFAEYPTVVFRPERDLPAAYLVFGAALDSAALMWIFGPEEIRSAYPGFFQRRVTRADGREYRPRIELAPIREAEFFERLWIQIRLDLQHNRLLNQEGQRLGGSVGQDVKANGKRGIWEDISEEHKSAIQEYWRESKALKQKRKRLFVDRFCAKKRIDPETFKSEKDRVETRMKRPGWADG
jgi:hypothetical protein